MSLTNGRHDELGRLLEAVCEDELTPAQASRLEELLLSDREARRFYLEYVDLHGSLYWDTAVGTGGEADAPSHRKAFAGANQTGGMHSPPSGVRMPNAPRHAHPPKAAGEHGTRRFASRIVLTGVAVLVAAAAGLAIVRPWSDESDLRPLAQDARGDRTPQTARPEPSPSDSVEAHTAAPRRRSHPPVTLPGHAQDPVVRERDAVAAHNVPAVPAPTPGVPQSRSRIPAGSLEAVVADVNEQIRTGWRAVGVEPSSPAQDSEWIRRVYLDLVGHIPPADEVERFLADRSPAKRAELIDRLLDEPAYVRHWTTVLTNLLIGRSMEREVNRPALEKFFRESFAANRPWNQIATELIAAEGPEDESGAATFLVAHLNNEAVPATAITARIFLGVQVGCVQCHDHPLNSDWQQEWFWKLNGFFQETQVVRHLEVDPQTGRRSGRAALVSRPADDLTYFETPRGVVKAVMPGFFDRPIDPDPETSRRRELARLMFEGPRPLAARALVNRLWAHFFGYGFTRPVDDMGPHNPPTHPELLELLTDEFIRSGYDLKALMRWIANSEAYQLSSRAHAGNAIDDPDAGESPAFSRMYVKPMTAEQLYDSVLVATRADLAAGSSWEEVSRQRHEWLQQFVHAFDTEENDEATNFDGTIPQALMMMNGELVRRAVASDRGTFFARVARDRTSDAEKIRVLCLAALSRYPTPRELAAVRALVRSAAAQSVRTGRDPETATIDCLRDVFWAYLNSSEFRLVH